MKGTTKHLLPTVFVCTVIVIAYACRMLAKFDIGGPAMIRAAAKNFKFVTVVTNPARYDEVAACVAKDGCVGGMLRMQLAQEAFQHTAEYDNCIQNYLMEQVNK